MNYLLNEFHNNKTSQSYKSKSRYSAVSVCLCPSVRRLSLCLSVTLPVHTFRCTFTYSFFYMIPWDNVTLFLTYSFFSVIAPSTKQHILPTQLVLISSSASLVGRAKIVMTDLRQSMTPKHLEMYAHEASLV